jgi:hypothetical protein
VEIVEGQEPQKWTKSLLVAAPVLETRPSSGGPSLPYQVFIYFIFYLLLGKIILSFYCSRRILKLNSNLISWNSNKNITIILYTDKNWSKYAAKCNDLYYRWPYRSFLESKISSWIVAWSGKKLV